MLKSNKFLIQVFVASLLFFMLWNAPKIEIFDKILKSQPLAFNYKYISGDLTGFTLHGVSPKKAPNINIETIVVKPSYLALFTGDFVADISSNIKNGEISGRIKQGLFSNNISLDIDFKNLAINPQGEVLNKTVLNRYIDGAKSTLSGNLKGDIFSRKWIDKSNNLQLIFNLSATELALKNLGVIQAGDINGTISMQEGALFADIHTLDDNKGFKFELDARSSLAPQLKNSNIAGDIKLSFLGGNETNKILFGNIGKPKLRPAQ